MFVRCYSYYVSVFGHMIPCDHRPTEHSAWGPKMYFTRGPYFSCDSEPLWSFSRTKGRERHARECSKNHFSYYTSVSYSSAPPYLARSPVVASFMSTPVLFYYLPPSRRGGIGAGAHLYIRGRGERTLTQNPVFIGK